jgi:hypothetical protein
MTCGPMLRLNRLCCVLLLGVTTLFFLNLSLYSISFGTTIRGLEGCSYVADDMNAFGAVGLAAPFISSDFVRAGLDLYLKSACKWVPTS